MRVMVKRSGRVRLFVASAELACSTGTGQSSETVAPWAMKLIESVAAAGTAEAR